MKTVDKKFRIDANNISDLINLNNEDWMCRYSTNCYAYALNIKTDFSKCGHTLQPGELSGKIFTSYSTNKKGYKKIVYQLIH